MIVDNSIDEMTARYFCAVDGKLVKQAMEKAKEFSQEKSPEKLGMQAAVALGPNPAKAIEKSEQRLNESHKLNENWLTDLFNSPPAWAEEPTGFNLAAPKEVWKDDFKGGLAGYNAGCKAAAMTSAAIIGASIPPVRNAALKIGKGLTKQAVKHPIAAAATAVAVKNADTVIDVAKNFKDDVENTKSLLDKLGDAFDVVCGWFKPLTDYFKEHPLYASAIGAIGYGLFKTYPLWWPYVRRLGYELTSGGILAKAEFEANGSDWTFEYSASKRKWVLLNAGRIASAEDSISFSQTMFAKKFID